MRIHFNPAKLKVGQLPLSLQKLVADFDQIAGLNFHPLTHLEQLRIFGKEGELSYSDIPGLRK